MDIQTARKYTHWGPDGRAYCEFCGQSASAFTYLLHEESCEVGKAEDIEAVKQHMEWERVSNIRMQRQAKARAEIEQQEANGQ